MATNVIPKLVSTFVVVFILVQQANAQNLTEGYYKKTCPSLEKIVYDVVYRYVHHVPGFAAALLRMHFHDCFVRGCDASVLIKSTPNNTAERDSIPNASLRGFEVIDAVKAAVEKKCRRTVSCADILALSTRDAVTVIGGPSWPVPLGRKDGRISVALEALLNLPPPFFNATQLIAAFAAKNLTVKDLVVLSGGHTIGISHCSSITTRIYNFTGIGDFDPALDPAYVRTLKRLCPPPKVNNTVEMDPKSSKSFDVNYYNTLVQNKGLFQSDAALLNNSETNAYVRSHVASSSASSFFKDFADSMVKMGKIEVLTGSAGEIRLKCSVINKN
ncbi:peroxidase 27-like [Dorcoceras hygrometricum]|uniref:Peroxidase n=1 Tax=Dorcoceras hygrometricum TaxID=472368 RepID=A0A2Z7C383_9LAMI|nr:peroxidase 27-like [Dorcoceras hygrometricum]